MFYALLVPAVIIKSEQDCEREGLGMGLVWEEFSRFFTELGFFADLFLKIIADKLQWAGGGGGRGRAQ